MMSTIQDSIPGHQENLRGQMASLTLVLKRMVLASAREDGKLGPAAEFAGLYVSEEEMRRCLDEDGPGCDRQANHHANGPAAEFDHRPRFDPEQQTTGSEHNGDGERLVQLGRRFDLSDIEVRILSFCLAPEVDVSFHRFFAYLQNDVSKKRPCIQFLARVCDGLRDVVEARTLLSPDAPLVRDRLLVLAGRANGQDVPIPLQQPVVAPTVIDFLFGRDRVDERVAGFARLVKPRRMPRFGAYNRHHDAILERLARRRRADGIYPLSYIAGPPGSQRARLVEQLALDAGKRVILVQALGLFASSESAAENLELLRRDATMHNALLHLENIDEALAGEGRPAAPSTSLQAWLTLPSPVPVVLTGTKSMAELNPVLGIPFCGFEIPHPSIEERLEIWSTLLREPTGERSGLMEDLAAKFRFTPGQIRAVLAAASAETEPAPGAPHSIRIDDLHRHCREASNQRLLAYAQKIVPKYRWNDIVLPPETDNQLREITGLVRHRRTVYGRWGFESKFSVGNGVAVLFAGPSGTGKTMSAEIIAGDLEVDLYKLDLSCVVSKYVGETERNLDRIFEEAETSNSILFFDEADALFGKRSEVKDAHDRYANIEINYLLQKLDDYVGVLILATNFKGNLDSAFTRRLNYIVDFSAPDIPLRRQIWAKVFPTGVPIGPDVDFDFLARKFEFSGGNIKNVALNSAFLAAADQGPIRMAHLIRAIKRECQKLGRLCSKSEFGPYLSLVRGQSET